MIKFKFPKGAEAEDLREILRGELEDDATGNADAVALGKWADGQTDQLSATQLDYLSETAGVYADNAGEKADEETDTRERGDHLKRKRWWLALAKRAADAAKKC